MSITKYSLTDTNKFATKIERLQSDILNLKMENKTPNSMALQIIGNGINKDGDILKPDALVVPAGKAVTFLLAMCSLYQDFNGTIYYPPGLNASFLTAESDYLIWNILGINAGTFNNIELSWTAGSRRTYLMQWVLGPGTYNNLKLYARIEQQNATPQRRSAPYYAFWIACMTILRTGGWSV